MSYWQENVLGAWCNVDDGHSDLTKQGLQLKNQPHKRLMAIKITPLIIIFNIYIAQINIQKDMINCALHIKIEYEITVTYLNAKMYTI